jgi:hypothetical protein
MEKRTVQRKERRSYFDKIEGDLRQIQSLDTSLQLAKNLGTEIIRQSGEGLPLRIIRELFQRAFGEEAGVSKLKNRKRYLLLPKEAQGLSVNLLKYNQVSKSGVDFLALGLALFENKSDAIHCLIEDTEYARKGFTPRTLNNSFDLVEDICGAISQKYNLMGYFEALKDNTVGAQYLDRNSADPSLLKKSIKRLNMSWENFGKLYDDKPVWFKANDFTYITNRDYVDEDGRRWMTHSLSPTILLGHIYTPKPVFKVKLPGEDAKELMKKAKSKNFYFEEYLREVFGRLETFEHPEFYSLYPWADEFYPNSEMWGQELGMQDCASEKYLTFGVAYSVNRIALSLLPNFETGAVSPVLLRSYRYFDQSWFGTWADDINQHWFNGNREIFVKDEGRTLFYEVNDECYGDNDFDPIEYHGGEPIALNSNLFNQICNMELDNKFSWLKEDCFIGSVLDGCRPVFVPDFDFDENMESVFPTNTISGIVNRHLLSSSPSESVFNKLAIEAAAFTSKLDEYLSDMNATYLNKSKEYKRHFS